MWFLLIPFTLIVGAWAYGAKLVASHAPPIPHDPEPAAVLPGGFRVGENVLVQPLLVLSPQFTPAIDMQTPLRGTVAKPEGQNLLPLGVQSLPIKFSDERVASQFTHIIPLTAISRA